LILRSIRLINFRSYSDSFFSFAPAGSIISGFNGSGKTNLLEAIAYSGTGKSVRFHHDEQLVRHDTAFFSIITDYRDQAGNTDLINLSCHQNKKLLKINNNPIRQLSHLFQTVKVTYLSPDDIIIINGSPRYRRQFFDLAMAQLFPEYIALYREYLHILLQRNALLKRDFTEAEKEYWDTRYIAAMIKVMIYRHRYLQLLNDELALYRNELRLVIGLLGISAQPTGYKWMGAEPDMDALKEALRQIRHREKAIQRSMLGVHLDDYAITLDDKPMKFYGSQGQKRLAIIAIKMAHARLIDRITHIQPILLFDDVMAELDDQNIQLVKGLIQCPYQVFIASPNDSIRRMWNDLPCLTIDHQAMHHNGS